MARELTLADGQLATTAAAILAGSDAPSRRVTVVFQNTGDQTETVVLTFRRAGGTARRVARAVLGEDDQLIVTGLPLQPDDTLLGVTTNASVVDYTIATAATAEGFRIEVLAATGVPKQQSSGTLSLEGTVNVDKAPTVADLLTESNALLRRVVLALEMLHGEEVPDPNSILP